MYTVNNQNVEGWYSKLFVAVPLQEVADDDSTVSTLFDNIQFDTPLAFNLSLSSITSNIEGSTFYFYHGSETVGGC